MKERDEYVETFLLEAEDLLSGVELAILVIEQSPQDKEALNRLFRAMHTIKGSGAMFGFNEVAAFAHQIETFLDQARNGSIVINSEAAGLILAAKDYIAALLRESTGEGEADRSIGSSIVAKIAEVSSFRLKQPTKNTATDDLVVYRIRFKPDRTIFSTGNDPALILEELMALGDCTPVVIAEDVPSFDVFDPESCYFAWDIFLSTEHERDAILDAFIFVESMSEITIDEISRKSQIDDRTPRPRLGDILIDRGVVSPERIVEALSQQRDNNVFIGSLLVDSGEVSQDAIVSALAEQKAVEKQHELATQETIRVPSDKLDKLINLIGELVIGQEQLNQLNALSGPIESMNRLVNELRDVVLNIRMMPVGKALARYKRLVRDIALELGKEANFVVSGSDTEMDKTILDRLADPLVHLIRNCIDHGIEMPAERLQNGKSRHGTIHVSAEHHGVSVVMKIEDDGRGLDFDAIRDKAVSKGLLRHDEVITETSLYRLVFAPGFSTASEVTNISGRGVGMDVVRREIEALRGEVSIDSEKGKGMCVTLTLPLTLAIIDGLMVRVGGARYVIPVSTIERCLEFTSSYLAVSSKRDLIKLEDDSVPIVRLRELFDEATRQPSMEFIVVTRVGEARLGIVVDEIIGDHQTVVKPLGRLYRDAQGFSGATILGDGDVALILDVAELLGLAKCETANNGEVKLLI